jgi:hypothetical protein
VKLTRPKLGATSTTHPMLSTAFGRTDQIDRG